MENNETNIISDDDFLREILGDVKVEQAKTETGTIEDIFLAEIAGEASEEKTDEQLQAEEAAKLEAEKKAAEDAQNAADDLKPKRFGVKDSVMTLIESGEWVDMPIKYGDKEYDNIEDLIEKEKPSKELFEQLSLAQKKYKDDLLNETYIKVGDKNTTKAKLVNAILHDVDYADLLEYNHEVVQPLQQIDFASIPNNERIAAAFVRQCLVEIDNYHPDSVDAVIANLTKDYRLIEKAEEYQKITIDNFNREVEKRQVEKTDKLKQEEDAIKEDMKNLRATLKTLEVNDDFSKKILKLRYTKDESGKFHYEKLIEDKIKDKSFEAKLMHLLLDIDDFVAKEKSKVKNEVGRKFMELVNVAPSSSGGSKKTAPVGNLQSEDEDFLRDIGLIE